MSHNFLEEKVEQVFKNFFNENVDVKVNEFGTSMRIDRGEIGIDNFHISERIGYFDIYSEGDEIHIYILFKEVDEALIRYNPHKRSCPFNDFRLSNRKNIYISKKHKIKNNQKYFIGTGMVFQVVDDNMHWGIIGDGFNYFHKKEKKFRF